MSFRKRLLFFTAGLFLALVLTALLAPLAVRRGVSFWLVWAARREGVTVEIGKITAPFLGAITIDELQVAPASAGSREVQLNASHLVIDLNFRGWIFAKHARLLRSIEIAQLNGSIRETGTKNGLPLDWRSLQRLLPDEFELRRVDLDVVTNASAFTFRGLSINASEIESGRFFAHQIFVTSPLLRQTFGDLRGATSWENDRLTIAGISFVTGLDLEALTIDLSRLPKRQLALDFQLDAFGGTLRASFEGRGGGKKFAIDLAGSASDISLAQISQAAGFVEPLSGIVRASKFTFRGSPGEFLDATASIWIDLGDFAWRARRADRVVFGGTYYDRRLQVEQLFVQQKQNELTVNGELVWPEKPIRLAGFQFRGELNAAIPDANAFAQLFGARAGDFTGALTANGELNSLQPRARGRLTLRGQGVTFRSVAFDSLGVELQQDGLETDVKNLQLRHGEDFLRGHGSVNLKSPHAYSARLTGAINRLADCAPLFPKTWRAPTGGGLTFDWSGDGTFDAHSGTMQLAAHGLQFPIAGLRSPFEVTLEGTYSPQDIFFRNCKLANDRFSLGGFVMLGSNFIELQALNLALDGVPHLAGTLFLPIGVDRWRKTGSLLEALDDRQKFDVDLAIDRLDLGACAQALGEKNAPTGLLDGKLAAFGPLASLQVTTGWHLQNLGPSKAQNKIDADLHYDSGRADAGMRAVFGVSSPLVVHASIPLRLQKTQLRDGSIVDDGAPFSVTLDCPALLLETMPQMLRPLRATGGLLTGRIDYGNNLRDPHIDGEAHLLAAKFEPAFPWPALTNLSADLHFENHAATISFLRFNLGTASTQWHGSLTTKPPTWTLTILPNDQIYLPDLPFAGAEIGGVFCAQKSEPVRMPGLREAVVKTKAGASDLGLTIVTDEGERNFSIDRDNLANAVPLLLEVAPASNQPALQLKVSDKQIPWP